MAAEGTSGRAPRPLAGLGWLLAGGALASFAPLLALCVDVFAPSVPDPAFAPRGEPAPRIFDQPRRAPRWEGDFTAFAQARAARENAEVAFYLHDVFRGWEVGLEADRPVYLASGIKLLFMVELFRQREQGLLSFDERLAYTDDDVRDGAPSMNRQRTGRRFALRDLLKYMIRDSDNAAADLVLRRVGADTLRASMMELGIDSLGPVVPLMDLRRSVYRQLDPRADQLSALQVRDIRWRDGYRPRLDLLRTHIGPPYRDYQEDDLRLAHERYYAEGRNHASMRDMASILERMVRGELLGEAASREMMGYLRTTWTSGRRIEGRLPAGTLVSHKTGTQRERICDLGILWLPDDTPLVFTIAVKGGERLAAEDVIADIARGAYELAWMEARTAEPLPPGDKGLGVIGRPVRSRR